MPTPDIVAAILSGRQPAGLQMDGLMKRLPVALAGAERKTSGCFFTLRDQQK